jgi:hypothetical protein
VNSGLVAVSPENDFGDQRQSAELDLLYRNSPRDRDHRTAVLSQASYLQKPYSPAKLGRLVREILHSEETTASQLMQPCGGDFAASASDVTL